MQEHCLTQMLSNSLCPQEELCSRDGLCLQGQPSQDTDMGGTELRVPIWHCRTCKAFLIHIRSSLEAIKRKGYFNLNFKAYVESKKAYVEQCSVIKQAKAHLAELDGSTDREAGTSRKSNKKSNVTTAEASQADLVCEIKQV